MNKFIAPRAANGIIRCMLIVPVSRSPDWRRPPLVLLLLILVNAFIFFGVQSRDPERAAQAADFYFASALPGIELPRYLSRLERNDPAAARKFKSDPTQADNYRLLRHMEMDADFMRLLRAGSIVPADDPEFALWQRQRQAYEQLRNRQVTERLGFKPAAPDLASLFGHMFLHGSVMHLLGNMAILFVVGYLVEETLGKTRFLVFYLLCGLGAAALDWAVDCQRLIPGIGASGAVSGVMAMFVALYGLQRIRFFYWVLVYFDFFTAPAIIMLPVWIGNELLQYYSAGNSHINYLAHMGGFVTGAILIAAQRRFGRAKVKPPSQETPVDPLVAERTRLARQLDELRLDDALQTARRIARRAPHDADLLKQYYMLARTHPAGEDIHRAAALVFALPPDEGASEFVHRTFSDYFKTARPSVRLAVPQIVALAQGFARNGFLNDAERLTQALASRDPAHASLPGLWLQVAEAYRRANNPVRQRELIERLRREHPHSQEAAFAASL